MPEIKRIPASDAQSLESLYSQLAAGTPLKEKVFPDVLASIYEREDYYLLGYYEGNDLLGTISAIICPDPVIGRKNFMIMENIVVKDHHRGKGIGKSLLTYIEDLAREKDCVFVQFCSSAFRTDAHRFYESAGYSPDMVSGYRKYINT